MTMCLAPFPGIFEKRKTKEKNDCQLTYYSRNTHWQSCGMNFKFSLGSLNLENGALYRSLAILRGGSTESHTSSHLTEELQELGSRSSGRMDGGLAPGYSQCPKEMTVS